MKVVLCAALAVLTVAPAASAQDMKLPPEVTPRLRAACESDVRRLCFGNNPTIATVKSCVMSKFLKLGTRCQKEIVSAGLL